MPFFATLGLAAAASAALDEPAVRVLTLRGLIDPASARYVKRELLHARDDQARAVVVRLDTPGGLDTSMREIVEAFLESRVPVIVFVEPAGARAASAGLFVTLAAHVAVMAPETTIGAAHPVELGRPSEAAEKWVNDAAALARSLANRRSRNAEWAERAVRASASLTASEAVALGVVDVQCRDLDELLRVLDGRRVVLPSGTRTLALEGAPVLEREMRSSESFLHTIADPNVAYLLFTLGVVALLAEFYHPGAILPAVAGATCLVLALVSFGSLPVNVGAIALLLIGIGLFVAEVHASTSGVAGAVGLVAFLLGSLWLYEPSGAAAPSDLHVSRLLIATIAVAVIVFFVYIARAVLSARKEPIATGIEALRGRIGTALTPLDPKGTVRVADETWTAISTTGPIAPRERVRVVGVEGVVLSVRAIRSDAPLTSPSQEKEHP